MQAVLELHGTSMFHVNSSAFNLDVLADLCSGTHAQVSARVDAGQAFAKKDRHADISLVTLH